MSNKSVKSALLALDRDGDGLLDYDDVLTVTRSLGIYSNGDAETSMMKKLGMSIDTKLPAASLVEPLTTLAASANPRRTLTDLFKKFDRAKNGTIAEKELQEVLKHLSDNLTEKEREELCKLQSENGKIVYSQLVDKLLA